MKLLTNLHKPALFVFFFSIFVGLSAQQTSKPRSEKWLKGEAFKNIDHFYFGFHLGIAMPMIFRETYDPSESTITTSARFEFSPILALPPHRLFGGYKWRRHYFELSAENKAFTLRYTTWDPYDGVIYSRPLAGYFISLGYNIDLLPKKNSFKINVGANAGIYVLLDYPAASPAFGINSMFEFPITKKFSLFLDVRYAVGTSILREYWEYPGIQHRSRLMSLDFNFGFRLNMFSKKNVEKGMKRYEELKSH